jgi:hypothetical protein
MRPTGEPRAAAADYTRFARSERAAKGARIGVVRNKLFGYSPPPTPRRGGDRRDEAQGAVIVDPANIPTLGKFGDPSSRCCSTSSRPT